MPNIAAAKKLNQKLAAVGNIASDGRPILGLDSRDLLEMVLETDPLAFLVPAHIWTPWFSLFGSKSGFDSVEECFGDLSKHIFAMETGLSSDPAMNWTWSALDRYRLISNSDAHSGEKLGREANLFQGECSYQGIYRALRNQGLGQKFIGTIEFFPEEGKYHLDGHRKCKVVMDPQETQARGGLCPVCGKAITRGVSARIADLADREEPQRPAGQPDFTSLIPLKELLGEILSVGSQSKKVALFYNKLISSFGSELRVLQRVPTEELKKHSGALAEGISRMREGQVIRKPGYDGEYGVISVFTASEHKKMQNGAFLCSLPEVSNNILDTPKTQGQPSETDSLEGFSKSCCSSPMAVRINENAREVRFNKAQLQAITAGHEPTLVLAGPGTGKTQTLMGRIRRLMEAGNDPRKILALTFTRRAAQELRERLAMIFDCTSETSLPQAETLHSLAFDFWEKVWGETPTILSEPAAKRLFAETAPQLSKSELAQAWSNFNLSREQLLPLDPDLLELAQDYSQHKDSWNLVDYTDLLEFYLERIDEEQFKAPYQHVLVDEVQDLSPLQLRLITKLCAFDGSHFFAIGDTKQSIYSFRGASENAQQYLQTIWPNLNTITLTDNYRNTQTILDTAHALFPDSACLHAHCKQRGGIHLFHAPDETREAAWISEQIKKSIGATSHSLADAGEIGQHSPGDIAILVRFKALIPKIRKALEKQGIPVSAPETEAFWHEPKIEAILSLAGRLLGLAPMEKSNDILPKLPVDILMRGPNRIKTHLAHCEKIDPFFWESRPFKSLQAAFLEHKSWLGLLNWIHLQTDLELISRKAEKVQIMTLHAAKGLEFELVFLPALEEGIVPFAGVNALLTDSCKHATNREEEKRLFYVGLSRAKQKIFLSFASKRLLLGKTLNLLPSTFLTKLPNSLISRSKLAEKKIERQRQIGLLD